jgi:hypothetical protein
MLFQNADAMIVHGEPNACGKTAHSSPDDDRVKIGIGARSLHWR